MGIILGIIRYILVALLILIGTLFIVIIGWTRWSPGGILATQWITTYMARIFNRLFRVQLTVTDPEALANHQGFIVANHVSYLDIVSMLAAQPVRMLSAAEVKTRPVIGWAATGAGTVYVDRSSMKSRRDAVVTILNNYRAKQDPPIAIFVEGRMGTGEKVFPFQLGIFKLAKRENIPYMPVAIVYDQPDIVVWHGRLGETMVEAAWRLATYKGRIQAKMIPLPVVHPTLEDNAARLADAAQVDIAAAIDLPILKAGEKE